MSHKMYFSAMLSPVKVLKYIFKIKNNTSMNCKFPALNDNNLGHKINRQMTHTLVKYLLPQQLLIYHPANIVDEMIHIQDDQDDLLFQSK